MSETAAIPAIQKVGFNVESQHYDEQLFDGLA